MVAGKDPELEAVREQLAVLQARVDELAARGAGSAAAPPGSTAEAGRPETAGEEAEEADVARVAPKSGEMVNIGEGRDGDTQVRRVPLTSLGGRGQHLSPLGYDVAMYLTRLLHRGSRAGDATISESWHWWSSKADDALSVSGDAGLLAIETATDGAPPRITIQAEPFLRREQPLSADGIAGLRNEAEEVASDLDSLASGPRLAMLLFLRRGARSSTELQEGLGLAPGQMYHHLKPLAAAGFLRRDGEGRYAISGTGRKALVAAQLLSGLVRGDRFLQEHERKREAEGDTRFHVYANERSTEVPLDVAQAPAGPPP